MINDIPHSITEILEAIEEYDDEYNINADIENIKELLYPERWW